MDGIIDKVWSSIATAEVTADVVDEREARRNGLLDLLLEIAMPGEADLGDALAG